MGRYFIDGSFDYVPIPDRFEIDERTYGNTTGLKQRKLVQYFPKSRRVRMANRSVHFDPEFATFTYGDPTPPKAGLRHLEKGDMLIFYCGLKGWDFISEPALYLMGYFEVQAAGRPDDFGDQETNSLFEHNFHVRHRRVLERQRAELVLIKGSERSRLLQTAVCISVMGRNCVGQPLKVLSPEMQKVFGTFGGRLSFQRSPTRWVDPAHVTRAAEFMKSLT
jgi:Nucleotide modification associated domain 3